MSRLRTIEMWVFTRSILLNQANWRAFLSGFRLYLQVALTGPWYLSAVRDESTSIINLVGQRPNHSVARFDSIKGTGSSLLEQSLAVVACTFKLHQLGRPWCLSVSIHIFLSGWVCGLDKIMLNWDLMLGGSAEKLSFRYFVVRPPAFIWPDPSPYKNRLRTYVVQALQGL